MGPAYLRDFLVHSAHPLVLAVQLCHDGCLLGLGIIEHLRAANPGPRD